MTEWRECKLGDVIVLNYGKALPEKKRVFGNIPVYSSAGLTGYHNESLVNGRGIIIGRKGTIGSVHFSYKPFWCIDTAYYITDNEEYNLKYIYYLLQTLGLNELNEDSAVPGLNRNTAYQQDISFPPLPEQKAIAEFLSSLDDKIDLLTRQNKTLEDLAQTYFRQRFIVEASDDWEVVRLGDILESLESGSRPKGGIDPELDDGVPSIGAESINGLGVYDFSKTKYVTKEFFNNMRRGVVKSHDVLIYKDGAYVGRKGMFGNNFPFAKFAVNEHVFILRTNEKASQIFLYFLLQEEELAQLNSNSAQPGLNQQAVNAFEIVLPPVELINDFEAFTEPLIDKIFENAKQMRTLQKLRDTLLPKLISGEVRVKQ